MGIQKVEKQRKIGQFVLQNETTLKEELSQVDEQLSFGGEDMAEALPGLTRFRDLLNEPEIPAVTPPPAES